MIEEDLDAALARQAAEEGVSKAALIRRYVRERLGPPVPVEDDPLWRWAGSIDGEPADDIDEVIYGGHERDQP